MGMLTTEESRRLYPRGLWVFDATGRQLQHVMACNPETGEVILWAHGAWHPMDWIRWRARRAGVHWEWLYNGSVHTRHGFWPAPLRLVERSIQGPEHWNCRCALIPSPEPQP